MSPDCSFKKLFVIFFSLDLQVTLTYPGLGLYRGREHVFNLTASPSATSDMTIDVRSACVNPICDAHWEWKSKIYRVRGLEKGDYELVKERNGPFAGKALIFSISANLVCFASNWSAFFKDNQ